MTKPTFPSDDIMREMAKLAVEKVTSDLAEIAEGLAADLCRDQAPLVTGPEALEAFAATIRKRNHDMYGTGKPDS